MVEGLRFYNKKVILYYCNLQNIKLVHILCGKITVIVLKPVSENSFSLITNEYKDLYSLL
jgi:hypothetical protein